MYYCLELSQFLHDWTNTRRYIITYRDTFIGEILELRKDPSMLVEFLDCISMISRHLYLPNISDHSLLLKVKNKRTNYLYIATFWYWISEIAKEKVVYGSIRKQE